VNPLSNLLADLPPTRSIARRDAGEVTAETFRADVGALACVIERQGRGRWLLGTEDAYACAVGLFALWQEDCTAVLPPNLETGSLKDLCGGVVGFVSDRAIDAGIPIVPVLECSRVSPRPRRALDRSSTRLELCTSGSAGARKQIPKSISQLESEIDVLEREFGALCAAGTVYGTVSHQHIYGLIFRVLWPLSAGRTFSDKTLADPASLAGALGRERGAILVSSPAHLSRFPRVLELERFRAECGPVFSSGGPLDGPTARMYVESIGQAPIEVLGSTETGGIAWRRQDGAESMSAFTPFDGVEVEAREGLLHVRSPRTGSTAFMSTGDAIEWAEGGRFHLRGRADRIVKLFEDRVSLDEIEVRLSADPLVDEAAALVIDRNGTPRIAVAVVLSGAGESMRSTSGRAALIARLRARLRPYFRITVMPRAWRFVARLPRDEQGKATRPRLEALFGKTAPVRNPHVVRDGVTTASGFEVELEVPHELWCLPGHFAGFPVVPGVVQLEWVMHWAACWTGRAQELRAIEGLKFKQALSGGTRFHLSLESAHAGEVIRFRLWNASTEFTSGRLSVAAGRS
jgi:3-hydroxymyristoyl/3-hydroxydecanoyl-(acyl carrier protein) dehydratase